MFFRCGIAFNHALARVLVRNISSLYDAQEQILRRQYEAQKKRLITRKRKRSGHEGTVEFARDYKAFERPPPVNVFADGARNCEWLPADSLLSPCIHRYHRYDESSLEYVDSPLRAAKQI